MAETDVSPRVDAEDVLGMPPAPLPEYDLPWRLDLPAVRTLRVVRRVVPVVRAPHLGPDDPRAVLYLPRAERDRTARARLGLGPWFRLSTRGRLASVAVLSAGLGLAGSYGTTNAAPVPHENPVAAAHVLGAQHWTAAAPRAGTWTAGPVRLGREDPATSCAAATLPADLSVFRRSTAPAGVGEQHVTRTASARAADALMETWLAGVRSCERAASHRDVRVLGTYPHVVGGLTVVGVFYGRGAARGAHLFAVGRDGRLVTTLELDVLGAPHRIPVARFTEVAKRALAELR
jgi:hypothetical protein